MIIICVPPIRLTGALVSTCNHLFTALIRTLDGHEDDKGAANIEAAPSNKWRHVRHLIPDPRRRR